ncbi:hypothetical protein BH20CHL2_BH20CHL2_12460 [soil metagenome]
MLLGLSPSKNFLMVRCLVGVIVLAFEYRFMLFPQRCFARLVEEPRIERVALRLRVGSGDDNTSIDKLAHMVAHRRGRQR